MIALEKIKNIEFESSGQTFAALLFNEKISSGIIQIDKGTMSIQKIACRFRSWIDNGA